ncbi:MAG: hypothetical protein COU11_00050 [Candidatus Harrisonbacteria bacterium CG10_big_fil_rev_8_21_14_0_10_49_15]|uniref:YdeI/OmpD-associated family protein n=1 Tax=Candidatus Harrisonbacteria bacterium CG10_big_fil_rev_8_21_14_0_10_49_15 TaxID=1974587 RepID=A0A2H0UM76_9BACT|nr:MAG: hypothetical protein COU11_00050 [Candidatus Harrisonbacteria bacterium CG10_big_fil_rev_8_21_14_0_10_49_15]
MHNLPPDFQKALTAAPKAKAAWKDITPLARNEWTCWITSPKKPATCLAHLKRAIEELATGKRRPCCWSGCTHRKDKPLSASQKFILRKQPSKKTKSK